MSILFSSEKELLDEDTYFIIKALEVKRDEAEDEVKKLRKIIEEIDKELFVSPELKSYPQQIREIKEQSERYRTALIACHGLLTECSKALSIMSADKNTNIQEMTDELQDKIYNQLKLNI